MQIHIKSRDIQNVWNNLHPLHSSFRGRHIILVLSVHNTILNSQLLQQLKQECLQHCACLLITIWRCAYCYGECGWVSEWVSEWVSDCCVKPNEHFLQIYHGRTSYIRWNCDDIRVVLNQHAAFVLFSDNSLK